MPKKTWKRERKRTRSTLLKIRATPLRRMPKSVFFRKIREACRHGVVPDDIRISTLNWDHQEGRRYHAGEVLSGSDRDELENCYQLLTGGSHSDIRFELPD